MNLEDILAEIFYIILTLIVMSFTVYILWNWVAVPVLGVKTMTGIQSIVTAACIGVLK